MQDKIKEFDEECRERVRSYEQNIALKKSAKDFMTSSTIPKYSYNFKWMGRPIIQYPQDMIAMQEIIWEIQPELIIETGIAHGGSLIYYASLLELIASCGGRSGRVLGIDIEIRSHNRRAIEAHPMSKRIDMIEGSSLDPQVVSTVKKAADGLDRVMVCLDSNHTHRHVLEELNAYAALTTIGSYCVVFDTIIEDLPMDSYPDRPWGKGDNPKTAVHTFLKAHPEFEIDSDVENKILITVAPGGFLKRMR